MEGKSLFFLRIFCMKILKDDGRLFFEALHLVQPNPERTVDARHRLTPLEVQHGNLVILDIHHYSTMTRSLGG
jgi:hypothetical protein